MVSPLRPPKTIIDVWRSLPEGTLCQLINNNLFMAPAPFDIHQLVLNAINNRLYNFLEKNPVGVIRIAPYDVHFSKQNIFQPDLIFLLNENSFLIKPRGLFGAPDLVVEVLSPGTASKDWGEKKDIYEKFGVKELFIVEPDTKVVNAFILKEANYPSPIVTTGFFKSNLLKTSIKF